MAFQKQTSGYSKPGAPKTGNTVSRSNGGGESSGKGSKTTHYMQQKDTKEYVNHVAIWENESKFEDGSPFYNLIVSEPLAPGKYTVTKKKVQSAE